MKGIPSVEALEGAHRFPGRYIFKAIGAHEQSFIDAARQAVLDAAGEEGLLQISHRTSSGGKHVSVTLTVLAESAEHVRRIYTRLGGIEGLRMLL